MEGLEITEVKFSYVKNFVDFRVDYDTYSKTALEYEAKLKNKKVKTIAEISSDVQNFGAYSLCNYIEYVPSGVPYLQTQNIRENIIHFYNTPFISQEVHEILWKSHCRKGQVLLTMAGAYLGKAAVYDKDFVCSSNQAVAKITLHENSVNPYFLAAFLNSSYGQFQIQRLKTVTGQPNINMSLIRHIYSVVLNDDFQKEIERVIKKAQNVFEKSFEKSNKANDLLLQETNALDWKPTEEAKAIKKFSNSFAISGRLDAEYYQPKFDEVLEVISNINHKTLGSIACFKKSIEPGSDAYQTEGIPFIRVSDISKFGLSEPEIHIDREIYNDETLKPKKDTILLSKDGSVGIAYKVEQDLDVITSSALLHLTITDKEVLPDYLTLVLNSKLTQMQAERDAGGSIIQHWRPDEIKKVLIPVLPMDIQKELSKQIQQSFKLRLESTKLVDIAKQAVEIAIEQDEQIAIKFIKDNATHHDGEQNECA